MKFHPVADLFPLMGPTEFEALKADIAANGLREPVWTWKGRILDGRNRWRACEALGIKPRVRKWDGDGSPISFVVSLNLSRRHLTASQKAAVAAEVEPLLAVEAAERRRRHGNTAPGRRAKTVVAKSPPVSGKARDLAAKLLGTNGRYVQDAKKVRELDPELFARVKAGEVRVDRARRQAERTAQRRKLAAGVGSLGPSIRRGDFRKVLADLPAGSVDCILTDPPYANKDQPLYGDVAALAARMLAPGGSLVVYCPCYAVAEVLPRMTPHLKFWAALTVRHTGPSSRLNHYRIFVGAKLLLWFVKGGYEGEWVTNMIDGQPGDKAAHEWAQGGSEAGYCIEKMCPPGGMVLDPMCGSGTTLIAARQLGRRFLGVEIDRARAKVAAAGLR
jgi:ParB-like chromosome segregation protein Spo0J